MLKVVLKFVAAVSITCALLVNPAFASYFEACELQGVIESEPKASRNPIGVRFQFRVTGVEPFKYGDWLLSPAECTDWHGKNQTITVNLVKPYRKNALSIGQAIVLRTVAFDAMDHTGTMGTFRWIESVDPPEELVTNPDTSPSTVLERPLGE